MFSASSDCGADPEKHKGGELAKDFILTVHKEETKTTTKLRESG